METINSELTSLPRKIDVNEIPRWLTEQYSGMEKDISDWYVSYYFWKRWDGQENTLDQVLLMARANAEARWQAMRQTGAIKGASDRSIFLQLHIANQTGWFRYVDEIEDVRELFERMLQEEIENNPDGGKRYDLEFIVKTLFPTMEKLGVPAETIASIPVVFSKIRYSVPVIRQLVNTGTPEAEQQIMNVLKEATDRSVSVRTFQSNNAERMGKAKPLTPQPVPGSIYLVPGNELIVIESDRVHTNAIQIALRGIVSDLSIRDGSALLKMLSERIMPKSNNLTQMIVHYGEDVPRLIRANGSAPYGYPLPSPEDFAVLVFQEAAKAKFYVDQILLNGPAYLSVYNIVGYMEDKQFEKWAEERFGSHDLEDLRCAVSLYYNVLNPDMYALFPNCTFAVDIGSTRNHGYSITLEICRN